MRRDLDQLRADVSRLKARKDSLAEVISHRSYTTESVKRLFTAVERGQAADLKLLGVLADFVEVGTGFEKATEEFLHEELEFVVVNEWSDAEGSRADAFRAGRARHLPAASGSGPRRAAPRTTSPPSRASTGGLPIICGSPTV